MLIVFTPGPILARLATLGVDGLTATFTDECAMLPWWVIVFRLSSAVR
jgi:hypothetical protein